MRAANTTIFKDNPSATLRTEHFVLAVMESRECMAYQDLDNILTSESMNALRAFYYDYLRDKSDPSVTIETPRLSNSLARFLAEARTQMEKVGAGRLSTEHVMMAILADEDFPVSKMLRQAGVTYGQLLSMAENNAPLLRDKEQEGAPGSAKMTPKARKEKKEQERVSMLSRPASAKTGPAKKGYVSSYCVSLNKLAEQGKIDRLVGRDSEIRQIERVLGRRKKNNAVVVGVSGCGKTALVQGLAARIQSGDVPPVLKNKEIMSLDLMAMLVGTQYRGVFEERVKGLFDELKRSDNYILFIDDIHNVMGNNNALGDMNVASTINDALNSGDVQMIGTTSFKDYKESFGKNPAMARRFQKITLSPSTPAESVEILDNIKDYYESFHHVTYTPDAVRACVELANKYISERSLPDSAIDIMDEAGSSVINLAEEPESVKRSRARLNTVRERKAEAKKKGDYDAAEKAGRDECRAAAALEEAEREWTREREKTSGVITRDTVSAIVSEITGIPASRLNADEKKKLSHIDEILKRSVVGQDGAIDSVCRAIKRSRVGLANVNRPVSFMFLGNSGTGKTLLAKKLAKEIFGDERYLIRLDMSEYSDKTSVNKLIGSNPGYVGFENGGQLTELIKNNKYCVLLLDEIEKADPEVYNVFLQVLDEGKLTDNTGQNVDFRNVIILMTSNVGARDAAERGDGVGLLKGGAGTRRDIVEKELKRRFPPEFINRLDEIIHFNPLTEDNMRDIARLEMEHLRERMKAIGHDIAYSDDTVEFILDDTRTQREFGARPIVRSIQENVENKITDLLLEGDYEEHTFNVMRIGHGTEASLAVN